MIINILIHILSNRSLEKSIFNSETVVDLSIWQVQILNLARASLFWYFQAWQRAPLIVCQVGGQKNRNYNYLQIFETQPTNAPVNETVVPRDEISGRFTSEVKPITTLPTPIKEPNWGWKKGRLNFFQLRLVLPEGKLIARTRQPFRMCKFDDPEK